MLAFQSQDAIVSAVNGANLAEVQKTMIDAAIKAGVKRFIPAEFGSSLDNPKMIKMVPLFAAKKEVSDYLETKEKDGLTWTGVINGPFFDWVRRSPNDLDRWSGTALIEQLVQGLEVGFLGYDLKNHKAIIYNGGAQRHCVTNLPTVGKAVAAVLSQPEKTANKYIHIASFQTTQKEVLALLEKATATKWEISKTTSEESHNIGMEKLERGDVMGSLVPLICSVVYDDELGIYEDLDNEMLGLPKEDLDTTVKALTVGKSIS